MDLVEDLVAREIGLRSLAEGIDTATPVGRMTLHVFGALAEFERQLVAERSQPGAAAKARGARVGGGWPCGVRPHAASRGRRHRRVWLVRLRRGPHHVTIAVGLGRPSVEHLARQIRDVINPPPLATPAQTR